MAKRKGFPPILCLVFLVFMQSKSCASCSGIPSNFNDVVLNATSLKITAGQVVTITATVPKDTTGAGVSWTSSAPPGIFAVTSVTVATYTAPNTVTAQFKVTVTATTLSTTISPPETASITITVNPPPPLKIKTTTLPNGVLGIPYPAGTQLQATGGVPPYQWTPAAGSLPPGLALNLDGTITGTPTGTAGVFNTFTVTVSDSETPPMTLTTTAGQLSITVT
ncbi:MAG: putative Ig domain-containing protein, partial [Candidatus Acidiferrales bacterium]